MKKLLIKNIKTGTYTHEKIGTQEEIDAWLISKSESGVFGKPERKEKDENLTQEEIDSAISSEKHKDEFGNVTMVFTIPSEFEHETTDYVPDYAVERMKEYMKIQNLLAEGLYEKELGDSTIFDEYVVLVNAIKAKYPKPE